MAPKTQQQMWFEQALGQASAPVFERVIGMPVQLKPEDVEGLVPTIVAHGDSEGKSVIVLKTYGAVSDDGDDDSLGIGKHRIMRDMAKHNPFRDDKSNERYFICTELTSAQVAGLMQTVAKERLALAYQAIRDAAIEAQTELINRQTSTLSPEIQGLLDQLEEVKEQTDQAARDAEKAEADAAAANTAKLQEVLNGILAAVGQMNG